MKIYAPVKKVNGVYASVRFVNGVGETDDPRLIEWFRSRGYRVEDVNLVIKTENDKVEAKNDEIETVVDEERTKLDLPENLESMTPIELREWAIANGLGIKIKNIRSKEKLLNIIRG